LKYFLGVDGGGTSTISYLADQDGHILGKGKSGPSNYQVVGAERALSSIKESIIHAYKAAGISIGDRNIDSVCFGLAGIDTEKDYQFFFPLLNQIEFLDKLTLLNDSYLALAGGNASADGIALIAGTGSIAVGINKNGQRKRVGGWGYILDDKGSGYNIAVNALHAVFRAYDGRGKNTKLSHLFCNFLELKKVENIINRIYVEKMSRKDIAELAKFVFMAALEDDSVAIDIIRQAGIDLADQVFTVIRELKIDGPIIKIPLVGGVFKNKNEVLLNSIKDELEKRLIMENKSGIVRIEEVQLIEPILQPAAGGLLIALDSLGIEINDQIIKNLKRGNNYVKKTNK